MKRKCEDIIKEIRKFVQPLGVGTCEQIPWVGLVVNI